MKRWIQRANSFKRALTQLKAAITLANERELSDLESQGLIQGFEYTHELAWKTLKDFFGAQGTQNLYGSRDTTRAAFRTGLIENGEVWMDMIEKRNLTSHTYDEELAAEVVMAIRNVYFAEFERLLLRFQQQIKEVESEK
ncbi:MAG: nucleotidyltransferase substrate binding protein [Candidatus Poribacteria bacterium]|nr:nucleotidyltransferase substrate binding protein [Candidatus Poribacteria bacterium]